MYRKNFKILNGICRWHPWIDIEMLTVILKLNLVSCLKYFLIFHLINLTHFDLLISYFLSLCKNLCQKKNRPWYTGQYQKQWCGATIVNIRRMVYRTCTNFFRISQYNHASNVCVLRKLFWHVCYNPFMNRINKLVM